MDKPEKIRVGLVVFAAALAVAVFVWVEQRIGPAADRTAVTSPVGQADQTTGPEPAAPAVDPAVKAALASAAEASKRAGLQPAARPAGSNGRSGAEAPPAVASAAPLPGKAEGVPATAAGRGRPVLTAPPTAHRASLYLPSQTAAWNRYEIEVNAPLLLQAGGRIAAGRDGAGPNGIDRLDENGTDSGTLALPSAPYLALIGRLCSREQCSDPFLVGSRTIVCPTALGVLGGNLQLWTNQRVRPGTERKFPAYAGSTGGFSVYAEAAPAGSCASGGASTAFTGQDATALDAGQTLDWPDFSIASGQNTWKPFFLPLDRPLRIRASGQMRPQQRLDPTGPDGVTVTTGARWIYPGSDEIVVDAAHPLFAADLPYQALIGRVCGSAGCGPAFLVGRERVVCADDAHRERLELWLNHILEQPGLLSQSIPLSMTALKRQLRVGTYRFTVAAAPRSACG